MQKDKYLEDGVYATLESSYSSKIYVKKEILHYDIKIMVVGSNGELNFTFGLAT